MSSDSEYVYCGTTTDTSFVFMAKNQNYVAIQKFGVVSFSLKLDFVTNANTCSNFPCQNGATCTADSTTTYSCACTSGFYGTNCENR